ncbi:MAG: hypothetical protein CM15mP103_12220 [Gammaproteobacteria bacterium]|nr:MAG: hypothetical protein CM15mP103_12220 [Gammaproteobacteria bacterium]
MTYLEADMAFPKVGNLAPKFSLSDHEGNTSPR